MVTVLLAWLLLSVLTALVCCLVARGGQLADRVVRSAPSALAGAGSNPAPSPRRPLEGMAEFRG
jgi:hypothetical protein